MPTRTSFFGFQCMCPWSDYGKIKPAIMTSILREGTCYMKTKETISYLESCNVVQAYKNTIDIFRLYRSTIKYWCIYWYV